MHLRVLAVSLVVSATAFSQLTTHQKLSEFDHLVSVFIKNYGPREWKQSAFRLDLLDNQRWVERVRATKNDIEFYDVMSGWVAQLDDAHDAYYNPSNFVANLNFGVDLYDGKLLVDTVDLGRLPPAAYPIAIGYELVSIDGEPAAAILDRLSRYQIAANPRSTRRAAAQLITIRPQSVIPHAPSVPDDSTVIFRRFDGGLETYNLRWMKTGLPLTSVGRFPDARTSAVASSEAEPTANPVARLANFSLPSGKFVRGMGALTPVFAQGMPATFQQRLGRSAFDPYWSGVLRAGNERIGIIRIPGFQPQDITTAVMTWAREIQYLQENTDGLIVDITRNPGGSSQYANALLPFLIHYDWTSVGVQLRATSTQVGALSSIIELMRAQGAPASFVAEFEGFLTDLRDANRNGSLAKTIPWDFTPGFIREPARDARGNLQAYTKPLMVLTDEFSASAADGFAAIIQDNSRGPLFGWRTMGAGGSVASTPAGTLSGGTVTLTGSLITRNKERLEEGGYPVSLYVENVGVHPDIQVDYMTRENLFGKGKPFVDAFVDAMVQHIEKNR